MTARAGRTAADTSLLPPGVVRLPRERLDEAAAVLARSFDDDPAFRHVLPDPQRRVRALPPFFRQAIADALPFGSVYAHLDAEEITGVAVWLPPGRFPLTLARKLRAVRRMVPVLAAAPRSFLPLARLGANVERAYPSGRYWYLEAIGVDQEHQGAGTGTRLLEPTLAVADRDGIPCYLETVSERNVSWYQRLGFRVHREGLEFLDGGPTYWTMIRQPRSS